MSDVDTIKTRLKDWVAAKSGKIGASEIEDDTPIMERRILSSPQIMDFILFLEDLTGHPVDVQNLKPGSFRDINSIVKAFVAGKSVD